MECLGPVRDARKDFWGSRRTGEKRRVEFSFAWAFVLRWNSRRKPANVATLDFGVEQHVFDKDGDFAFFFGEGGDGEAFLGAGKRDIKEAALFLNVKLFGGLAFFHESGGQFG